MKKLLAISILAVMLILLAVTGVNATTSSELPDVAYEKFAKFGMTSGDKIKIERYLSKYPVTDSQADELVAKADSAVATMNKAGKTNYADLTANQKDEIKKIANEAAEILGLTLVFENNEVKIYKDGKYVDVVSFKGGKLVYTGNADLGEIAYNKFSKYGMTKADQVKIERYLSKYPVTDSQANELVAKADAAIAVMEKAGKTNYADLTESQKAEIKTIANEAAKILDLTLVFENNDVKIYKNGKLLDVVSFKGGKLVYTGNNNTVLVVSSIAVIALASAGVVVARKKLANA